MAAARKQEPEVLAVNQVFGALKPLPPDAQQRVLSSALALLGVTTFANRRRAGDLLRTGADE